MRSWSTAVIARGSFVPIAISFATSQLHLSPLTMEIVELEVNQQLVISKEK
jgi:hypothetical protein